MYKYRTKYARIVLGEPLPEKPPLPKPVPKNIVAEALKVKAFFTEDPERNFRHASQHFKVSKARISQLMKIVDVLPEDFVEYMGHCKDETIIRRFSGKTLLRIAGIESPKQRQDAISELMEEFEVGGARYHTKTEICDEPALLITNISMPQFWRLKERRHSI